MKVLKQDEVLRPKASQMSRFILILCYFVLYVPLIVLVLYSFLDFPYGIDQGWTLEWYRKLFQNELVLNAFWLSLYIALTVTFFCTAMGLGVALGLRNSDFPGKKIIEAFFYFPLVMPEIVMGLSLLVWFVVLKLELGIFSIVVSHLVFCLSYVILTLKAQLSKLDPSLEEAARDLGARGHQVFLKVTLPFLWPGILSGALISLSLSLDDFLITFFTAGVGAETLPLKIYSMIKFGLTPEINALSTLMLGVTFLSVFLFFKPTR